MHRPRREELLEQGRLAFNRGEFYEAHELWEAVWDEADDPDRRWIQGMIQIATGLHKLQRDRPDLCQTLFAKALPKLSDAPERFEGMALGELRTAAASLTALLAAGERPSGTLRLHRRS